MKHTIYYTNNGAKWFCIITFIIALIIAIIMFATEQTSIGIGSLIISIIFLISSIYWHNKDKEESGDNSNGKL